MRLARRLVKSLNPTMHYQVYQELGKRSLCRPLFDPFEDHPKTIGRAVPKPAGTGFTWKVQLGKGPFVDRVEFKDIFTYLGPSISQNAHVYVSPWMKASGDVESYFVCNYQMIWLATIQATEDTKAFRLRFNTKDRLPTIHSSLSAACEAAIRFLVRCGKIVHWPEIFPWVK